MDASVVVEALVADTMIGELARQRLKDATSLHAPHLVDVEVTSALRGLVLAGKIEVGLASTAVRQLTALPITRYAHQPFVGRIWELRSNLSAYDAAYVSLAEAAKALLLTTDVALAKVPGLRCEVELLA